MIKKMDDQLKNDAAIIKGTSALLRIKPKNGQRNSLWL